MLNKLRLKFNYRQSNGLYVERGYRALLVTHLYSIRKKANFEYRTITLLGTSSPPNNMYVDALLLTKVMKFM
jgi:hypothetical protein